jgi:phage/plasmid primase-like uncharacterized protein
VLAKDEFGDGQRTGKSFCGAVAHGDGLVSHAGTRGVGVPGACREGRRGVMLPRGA